MGDVTKIEWCDHTSSPWHGFVKQFGSNAEEGFGVNRKLLLQDKIRGLK